MHLGSFLKVKVQNVGAKISNIFLGRLKFLIICLIPNRDAGPEPT